MAGPLHALTLRLKGQILTLTLTFARFVFYFSFPLMQITPNSNDSLRFIIQYYSSMDALSICIYLSGFHIDRILCMACVYYVSQSCWRAVVFFLAV